MPPLTRASIEEDSRTFQPWCTRLDLKGRLGFDSASVSTSSWSMHGSSTFAIMSIWDRSFLLDGFFINIGFGFPVTLSNTSGK